MSSSPFHLAVRGKPYGYPMAVSPGVGQMTRVVVSLTTIPGRRHHLIRAIASIRRQTRTPDAIYLWLPTEHFQSADGYHFSGVDTYPHPDLGPATKLLPILGVEQDPATLIIPLDDDIEYPVTLVERLVGAASLWPGQALGFTGWCIDPDVSPLKIEHFNEDEPQAAMHQEVHVLEGYRGVIYQRGFFENDVLDHLRALESFRFHDDILLSGYLAARGITRAALWLGSGGTESRHAWGVLGADMGLHTGPDWLAHGLACVAYWRKRHPDLFTPVPRIMPWERLHLTLSHQPRPGFGWRCDARVLGPLGEGAEVVDDAWRGAGEHLREILITDPPESTTRKGLGWLAACLKRLVDGGVLTARLSPGKDWVTATGALMRTITGGPPGQDSIPSTLGGASRMLVGTQDPQLTVVKGPQG